MRIDLIADTNILINEHEGNKTNEPFLKYNFGISFFSEIELLGYPDITDDEERKLRSLIQDCFEFSLNSNLKEIAINLKRKYNLKLPDAIIASTAVAYHLPLVNADKGLVEIEELNLILVDFWFLFKTTQSKKPPVSCANPVFPYASPLPFWFVCSPLLLSAHWQCKAGSADSTAPAGLPAGGYF